ncbi:hypothetical protein NST84_16890 [Paenibacillus sp. FSL R7-0345]|uniref:hypothetical protein n=1 Tax=Paenibacillus sp. FSL R7-0345 TaxID=2954535 RepID=UPI00315A3F55
MRVAVILLAAVLAAGIADLAGTDNNQQAYIKPTKGIAQASEAPAARLYTSLEKEKGKYTDKVKALLEQLLGGLHAAH